MPQTARAMRVLVVDDYPDTVESTALLLKLGGHEIETAKDGVQAIERAASFRPDLVLLDLGLPALDGLAVARRIQDLALPPKPYLVAVSGYAKPQDKRRCAEAGFDLHIAKPLDAEVFQGIAELLQLSSDTLWTSRSIAAHTRADATRLIAQQIEMANLFLDISESSSDQADIDRRFAKAEAARDKVTIWLNRGACMEDRLPAMVKALSALRERLYLCKTQKRKVDGDEAPR